MLLFFAFLGLSIESVEGAEYKVGVPGVSSTKLHLGVGQSYILHSPLKVRWISVGDSAVAEATVVAPTRMKVTGKAQGTTLLVYWNEANVPASVDLDVWGASEVLEKPVPIAAAKKPEVEPLPTVKPVMEDVASPAASPDPAAGISRNAAEEDGSGRIGGNKRPFRVVVLPVENLTGKPAPLKEIRLSLAEGLKTRGIAVLAEKDLESFMEKHRMRYTGGITKELSQAFFSETGADAVLITSLEYFSEGPPPRLSLITRLVSAGEQATILWMKSVGMSGDDHPGFLGTGLILTSDGILRKAIGDALDSLARSVSGGMAKVAVRSATGGKFRPKRFYRSSEFDLGGNRTVSIAVVPFINIGTRKNAGRLMELHFVDQLAQVGNVRVIEPGVVREEFLRRRVIMQEGLSVPQADLLFEMLDVDLLLAGTVAEYQDSEVSGGSAVGFSVLMFDMKSRRVVFSSRSYNRGDDGVFFFELGEVKTALAMASRMAWAVIERMFAGMG